MQLTHWSVMTEYFELVLPIHWTETSGAPSWERSSEAAAPAPALTAVGRLGGGRQRQVNSHFNAECRVGEGQMQQVPPGRHRTKRGWGRPEKQQVHRELGEPQPPQLSSPSTHTFCTMIHRHRGTVQTQSYEKFPHAPLPQTDCHP